MQALGLDTVYQAVFSSSKSQCKLSPAQKLPKMNVYIKLLLKAFSG